MGSCHIHALTWGRNALSHGAVLSYPYTVTPDENGTFLVVVAGIPGAFTACRSRDEARDMALDVALTMLAAMMDDAEDIPAPPDPTPGQAVVDIPPVPELKLALYQAMRRQGVSQVRLAALLGTDPKSVRRLLDLFHASRWDHLEMALEALGYRARVMVEPMPSLKQSSATGRTYA